MSEDSLYSDLGAADLSLIILFLQELKEKIEFLENQLARFFDHTESISILDDCIAALRVISQGSQLIQLTSINQLSHLLEKYFQGLLQGAITLEDSGILLIQKTLRFLHAISETNPIDLKGVVSRNEKEINDLNQELVEYLENQHIAPIKEQVSQTLQKLVTPVQQASEGIQSILIDSKMFDLFCIELESQCAILNQGLLELEYNSGLMEPLDVLMRSAHSIKGAARVVALNPIVRLAHAMEDCFLAAQSGRIEIDVIRVDILLRSVDLLSDLSKISLQEVGSWIKEQEPTIDLLVKAISSVKITEEESLLATLKPAGDQPILANESRDQVKKHLSTIGNEENFDSSHDSDRILRVTARHLNRLMGLAGESLIASRWLYPFENQLHHIRKRQAGLSLQLDELREHLRSVQSDEDIQRRLNEVQRTLNECRYELSERVNELDNFVRRYDSLSDRLYQEVINSRMRPFSDLADAFPRMVRDMSKQLKKKIKLDMAGKRTPVDRDILEKLEVPLIHLLRNAIDHGIESAEERRVKGKQEESVIKLEARHRGGILLIKIRDDGRGVDIEKIRRKIVEKKLVSEDVAQRLTDAEILDFLFLPGFSTAMQVTEISGRGMGLNIVRSTIQEIGGTIKITNQLGKGLEFCLQLPLTLSVVRTLLVEISEESYAFPLARIDRAILVDRKQVQTIGNRQFFQYEGKNIGLVSAWQVLELKEPQLNLAQLPVVLVGDANRVYGLVVDRLIGGKELVAQDLIHRFGKIPDIIAGALMEDGNPVLIIDIEDLLNSIDNVLSSNQATSLAYEKEKIVYKHYKRVLVVEDSITVREVECRLLRNQGYQVDAAVNGLDGWNALRTGQYDLVVTDIDMPLMNGIELVRAMRKDPRTHHIPVMIVSYKDREEDRLMGLEAGADYYFTKNTFHDATLIDAVQDLIGKATDDFKDDI